LHKAVIWYGHKYSCYSLFGAFAAKEPYPEKGWLKVQGICYSLFGAFAAKEPFTLKRDG
jgi:hypothetical protein